MSKRAAQVPPTHTEVITWHEAPALPDSNRFVLVGFGDPNEKAWVAYRFNNVWLTVLGAPVERPVKRWADLPTGNAFSLPAVSATAANSGQVVAELGKTAQGYLNVDFTQIGRQLPPGVYELRATTKPTPGG
jgi:hypothetical protein